MVLISERGIRLRFPESQYFGVYCVMQGKYMFSIREGKINLSLVHFLFCLEQYRSGLENKVTIAASSVSVHFLIVSAKLV